GLANVRKHSQATMARVTVYGGKSALELQIVDDGRGFPVEQTLIRAAKRGRLGLVGIGERVRMLGGKFDVESRPGGPTTLSLRLPRWQPPGSASASLGSSAFLFLEELPRFPTVRDT